MLTRLLCGLLLLSTPLLAQQESLELDMNGDGDPEYIQLIETKGQRQHLIIDSDALGTTILPYVSDGDSMAATTSLLVTPSGSIQVERAHLGIGRHKWILTITLAFRNDAIRVAGVTYQWYDTLKLEEGGTCDLNLLTGKGVWSPREGTTRQFTTDIRAPLAHNWQVHETMLDC